MNARIRLVLRLVVVLMLIAASFFIAKAVSSIIARKLVALTPYDPPITAAGNAGGIMPKDDLGFLVYNRNLFNQKAVEEEEEEFVAPPPTTATGGGTEQDAVHGDRPLLTGMRIQLIGTQVAIPAQYSLAMIRSLDDKEGDTMVLTVGDVILKEAQIVQIVRKRIYFRRPIEGGRIEYIDVDTTEEDIAAAAAAAPPLPVARPAGGREGGGRRGAEEGAAVVDASVIRRVDTDTYAIPRTTVEEVRRNPQILQDPKFGAIPKLQPVYQKGSINGYRLLEVQSGSIYAQLGIRSGDTLLDINGQQLDNPQKAMSFFDQLQPGQNVGIRINRNGQEKTLTYQLD